MRIFAMGGRMRAHNVRPYKNTWRIIPMRCGLFLFLYMDRAMLLFKG